MRTLDCARTQNVVDEVGSLRLEGINADTSNTTLEGGLVYTLLASDLEAWRVVDVLWLRDGWEVSELAVVRRTHSLRLELEAVMPCSLAMRAGTDRVGKTRSLFAVAFEAVWADLHLDNRSKLVIGWLRRSNA